MRCAQRCGIYKPIYKASRYNSRSMYSVSHRCSTTAYGALIKFRKFIKHRLRLDNADQRAHVQAFTQAPTNADAQTHKRMHMHVRTLARTRAHTHVRAHTQRAAEEAEAAARAAAEAERQRCACVRECACA